MFLILKLIHPACLKLGHLTLFHEQVAVSSAKPPPKPDPEVDDPLYLMTLTIPELFLRPYQVTWDATVFGVFNPNFPLYIKTKTSPKSYTVVNVSAYQCYSCGFYKSFYITFNYRSYCFHFINI